MSMNEDEEKDLELKDLIVQTLESNGLLAKMKAQIRASVFMALDENDTTNNTNSNDGQSVPQQQQHQILPEVIRQPNQAVQRLLGTDEHTQQPNPQGSIVASLVRDFLEVCNLDYTLAVFDPELNNKGPLSRRKQLQATLKLIEDGAGESSASSDPVLLSLVKRMMTDSPLTKHNLIQQQNTNYPSSTTTDYRAFFETHGSAYGPISKRQVFELVSNLFPAFTPSVLKAFVNAEMNDPATNGSSSDSQANYDEDRSEMNDKIIDADMFVDMCNKWHSSCQKTTTTSIAQPQSQLSQSNNKMATEDDEINKEVFDQDAEEEDADETTEKSAANDHQSESNGMMMIQSMQAPSQPPVPPPSQLPALPEKKKKETNVMFRSNDTEADNGDNYDEDFTAGNGNNGGCGGGDTGSATNTPRTPRSPNKSSQSQSQSKNMMPNMFATKQRAGAGISDEDEIDENLSYCESESKMDEMTQDKSLSTCDQVGGLGADYIEDVSI